MRGAVERFFSRLALKWPTDLAWRQITTVTTGKAAKRRSTWQTRQASLRRDKSLGGGRERRIPYVPRRIINYLRVEDRTIENIRTGSPIHYQSWASTSTQKKSAVFTFGSPHEAPPMLCCRISVAAQGSALVYEHQCLLAWGLGTASRTSASRSFGGSQAPVRH